jgi:predicted nucleic acid-binding protein
MIVVADTGPLQYLVRIAAIDVLAPLYQRVLVPQSVARELQQNNTPAAMRAWITHPPAWCEVRPDPPADPALAFLDPGERAAIPLALAVQADRLLIDDLAGRGEAERRHLSVTGTVGVLADAHVAGLLDFEQKLLQLRQTNFYVSDEVVGRVRQRLARAEGRS